MLRTDTHVHATLLPVCRWKSTVISQHLYVASQRFMMWWDCQAGNPGSLPTGITYSMSYIQQVAWSLYTHGVTQITYSIPYIQQVAWSLYTHEVISGTS